MHPPLHKKLLADIDALRAGVAVLSTQEVVRKCSHYLVHDHPTEADNRLLSPPRQVLFLLGLLFGTPEPELPVKFDSWPEVCSRLNSIFDAYTAMYFVGERAGLIAQSTREIASAAFLHYFNQGRLVSPAQYALMIEKQLVPFDADLKKATGISASEALRAIRAIEARLELQAERCTSLVKEEKAMRLALLDDAERLEWSDEAIRAQAIARGHIEKMHDRRGSLDELGRVRLEELRTAVGPEIANAFWTQFSMARGSAAQLTYPTDENEAEYRPIYLLGPDVGLCLCVNEVYAAPFLALERVLDGGAKRDSFHKRRGDALEQRVVAAAAAFFDSTAKHFPSVSETPGTAEHDLIVLWQRRLFVFEAKASPPREPLRDPAKALPRVRDDFRSDKGIQGAFEQANRIRTRWVNGETIQLYDSSGAVVASIAPSEIDKVYLVCVTGDDFGMLAVDLSLLLTKEPGVPYPWAVNIHDLETLLRGWRYRGWAAKEFCTFLDQRLLLHGKVKVDDELDIAGYYLQHGSFGPLISADADKILLSLDYSVVFDRIASAERGGPPVDFTMTAPVVNDLRDVLGIPGARAGLPAVTVRKVGRNSRCPCGSGAKFKRCCGRPGTGATQSAD